MTRDAREAVQARRAAAFRLGSRVLPLPVRAALRRARTRPPEKPAPAVAPPSPWPYRINLVLFIAAVLLATLWFENHLRLYVSGTRIVTGTMTLWGLWKLIQSAVGWGGWQAKPLAQRGLGAGWATETLAFAVIVFLVLNLTTSSLYLVYDDAGRAPEVEVQISEGGRPLGPPWTLHSYDPAVGRPFFLRWRPQPLSLEILKPRGYLPRLEELGRGASRSVRVTAAFRRKQIVAVCLWPGAGIVNDLPEKADEASVLYSVRVTRGDEAWTFANVRRTHLLCTGAGAEDLKAAVGARNRDTFRQRLEALVGAPGMPPERLAERVRFAEDDVLLVASREFAAGDLVTVEVFRDTESAGPSRTFTLSGEPLQQFLF
jgi:hypothetical protein